MIPGKELVGRNARIVDGYYVDDYTTALNEFATPEDVFGVHMKTIARFEPYTLGRATIDALGDLKDEEHLVAIIKAAAHFKEWRAIKRGPDQTQGLDAVVEKGFGYVTEHEGTTFLLPSAHYLTYCKRKF